MRNQQFNTEIGHHKDIHHAYYNSDMIHHKEKHSHIQLHDTDHQNMLSTECKCAKECH